jgi:hypothetical protein
MAKESSQRHIIDCEGFAEHRQDLRGHGFNALDLLPALPATPGETAQTEAQVASGANQRGMAKGHSRAARGTLRGQGAG